MVDSPEQDRDNAEDYSDRVDSDTDGFGPSTVQGDVILEVEDIFEISVVSLGPNVISIYCID